MTTDKLRAAATGFVDRVAKAVAEGYRLFVEEHDGLALAEAWLAEHPADDGEAADEAWSRDLMKSLGAVQLPKARPGDDETFELELPNSYSLFWCQNTEGNESYTWMYGVEYPGRCEGLPDQHTRGAVRRLLAALGVTP